METVEVDEDGSFKEDGTYSIPGVKGTASEIKVAFVDPAGSMTATLFPTGNRTDNLHISERNGPRFSVKATLIDAANPFVVVDSSTLPHYLVSCSKDSDGYLEHMESIRRAGAVMMGLATSIEEAGKVRGTPKLAIVYPPQGIEAPNKNDDMGLRVQAFSMGKPHPSLQLTGAACLASAVCIEGTVAHRLALVKQDDSELLPTPERTPSPELENYKNQRTLVPETEINAGLLPRKRMVRLQHSSGAIGVEVLAASSDDVAVVDRCVVSRTARRLFEGKVWYYE